MNGVHQGCNQYTTRNRPETAGKSCAGQRREIKWQSTLLKMKYTLEFYSTIPSLN